MEAQVDAGIDYGHEVGDEEEHNNVHRFNEYSGHIEVVGDLYERVG